MTTLSCASSQSSSRANPVKSEKLIEVWIPRGLPGDDFPPIDFETPPGFAISPYQAYLIVRDTEWLLSDKHRWACYRDDTHYYIYDMFLKGASAKHAKEFGVKVNGQTGKLE